MMTPLRALALGLGASLLAAAKAGEINLEHDNAHAPFLYGVASGDPQPDSVLLWTHVDLEDGETQAELEWSVYELGAPERVVASGVALATAERDGTVTVEASGLSADTRYSYVFRDAQSGQASAEGRTRTAPLADDPRRVKLASTSCSSIWSGYFNAYRWLAADDSVDLVVHLGDYIYPDQDPDECVRVPPGLCSYQWWTKCDATVDPSELQPSVSAMIAALDCDRVPQDELYRYRWVHKYHLLDPDLRLARQAHPMVVLFDNHDTNDRSAVVDGALRAWTEWVPSRARVASDNRVAAYRRLAFGQHLDLVTLDNIASGDEQSFFGEAQFAFVDQALAESKARGASWRVFASAVQFTPWATNNYVNAVAAPVGWFWDIFSDKTVTYLSASSRNWDGNPQTRRRFARQLLDAQLGGNNVFITGDMHMNIMADVYDFDPADKRTLLNYDVDDADVQRIGVEFMSSSMSRGNVNEKLEEVANLGAEGWINAGVASIVEALTRRANPQFRYLDMSQHGFGLLTLDAEEATAQFVFMDKLTRTDEADLDAPARCARGQGRWQMPQGNRPAGPDAWDKYLASQGESVESPTPPTPPTSPLSPPPPAEAAGPSAAVAATAGTLAGVVLGAMGTWGVMRRQRAAASTTVVVDI